MKGQVVWKFEDNFNADLIVGSHNITVSDKEVLGKACLAEFDPEFVKRVNPGDIMVAGKNFGYGHPHYQGIISLKQVGISTLVAESFYPMWYRVAIFYAFPPIVCKGIAESTSLGDQLEADPKTGLVKNLTTGVTLQGEPVPSFLLEIIKAGGFPKYAKAKLETSGQRN
ncbi:3-isopropylmalate dehydratase [Chloroflexota bacterium]